MNKKLHNLYYESKNNFLDSDNEFALNELRHIKAIDDAVSWFLNDKLRTIKLSALRFFVNQLNNQPFGEYILSTGINETRRYWFVFLLDKDTKKSKFKYVFNF